MAPRGRKRLVGAWSGDRQMVLRLVASRGPEPATEPVCYVLGAALSPVSCRQRSTGVRVLLLDRGFTAEAAKAAPWLLAGAKTLSYGVNMAALRYAGEHGADDVDLPRIRRRGAGGADLVGGRRSRPGPDHTAASTGSWPASPCAGCSGRRLPPAGGPRTGSLAAADLHAAGRRVAGLQRPTARPGRGDRRPPRSDGGLTAELAQLLDVPGARG